MNSRIRSAGSSRRSFFYSWHLRRLLGLAIVSIGFFGCNDENTASAEPSALAKKGRTVYQTNCIACHNTDPKRPGSLGPDVYGSSKALLEARILKAEYPPGYQPKRSTHMMTALPHLKNEIDAIHAFLNGK